MPEWFVAVFIFVAASAFWLVLFGVPLIAFGKKLWNWPPGFRRNVGVFVIGFIGAFALIGVANLAVYSFGDFGYYLNDSMVHAEYIGFPIPFARFYDGEMADFRDNILMIDEIASSALCLAGGLFLTKFRNANWQLPKIRFKKRSDRRLF